MKIMTKRFLVAVCLLVVSATLLGSASFAWFSMNTDVNVEGIEVEAYSDALFLEIANRNEDSAFDISTILSGGKKALRLVTNASLAGKEVVKIVVADATGNYDGTGTYYVKADSDVTDTTYGANDGKDNYVVATDLEEPSDTSAYFIVTFTKASGTYTAPVTTTNEDDGDGEDDGESTTTTATVYYAKDLSINSFVPVTGLEDGDSLSPYYTATITEQTNPVYDGVSDYYECDSNGVYHVVGNLELGTKLDGKYFTIEYVAHDEDFEDDTETEPTEPDPDEPDPNDPELQDDTETETTVEPEPYYYVKNANGDFTCLGFAITEALDTYPGYYWGRAYSGALGSPQGTNTLNVIDTNDNNNDYYYFNTVYLRSAENTNPGQNLRIEEVKVGGRANDLSAALRILFVATNGNGDVVRTTYDNGDASQFSGALFDTILGDKGEVVTVEMYVYFDGTDEVAKTLKDETAGLLNGQTIEVKFAIDGPDYNN